MNKLNFPIQLRLLVILVLAVSISCTNREKKEQTKADTLLTIPFAELVKDKREVKLSEFASDIKLIQLENTPEALIGTFENIEYSKDFIFIMCWTQPIMQFSRTGKFIKQIGKIGKGPGEYSYCTKMSIDEKNKHIYIQTVEFNIMVFNFDGDYIKTIQCPDMKYYVWSRDSMLVSYFEPISGDESFVFVEHNEQGDTLQGIPNYISFDESEQANPFRSSSFREQNFSYRFEDKLHLKGCYNDTVYSYDENNQLTPKFFIDLKQHKLPEELVYERKWNRSMPDGLCWTGIHETSNYLFLPYGYHYDSSQPELEKEERGYVLYNKQANSGAAVEEAKQAGFTDDLNGGPHFRPILTYDHTAIMLVSALDLKQYLNSDRFKNQAVKFPEEKEKLVQLNKTLKEDDNHFIVEVSLKE